MSSEISVASVTIFIMNADDGRWSARGGVSIRYRQLPSLFSASSRLIALEMEINQIICNVYHSRIVISGVLMLVSSSFEGWKVLPFRVSGFRVIISQYTSSI